MNRCMYRRATLGILALALPACHANHYSTPRTVPKGLATHTVAVHAEPLPAMVYIARLGLTDRIDIGAHATVGFNRLDLKVNFLRSQYLDMAIDPSVGYGYEPVADTDTWKGTLPLMVGLNITPRVTLMLQGGPVLLTYRPKTYDSILGRTLILSGAVGGGVQIRITELISIQPEVSFNYFEYDPVNGTRYWPNIGVGVGFGPQPRYDAAEETKR